jgi:hypothetical protein
MMRGLKTPFKQFHAGDFFHAEGARVSQRAQGFGVGVWGGISRFFSQGIFHAEGARVSQRAQGIFVSFWRNS